MTDDNYEQAYWYGDSDDREPDSEIASVLIVLIGIALTGAAVMCSLSEVF